MQVKKVLGLVIGYFFLTFLWFDFVWALDSTFSSFSFFQSYVTKFFLASVLAAPLVFIRSRWYPLVVGILLDLLLIANLMYFRTYYTAIPWNTYFIAGNLADFKESVYASLEWWDWGFVLLTAAYGYLSQRYRFKELVSCRRKALTLLSKCLVVPALILVVNFWYYGGFKKAYDDLMFDYQTCGTPIYSVFGSLYYEHLKERVAYTPEIEAEIEAWLDEHSQETSLPFKIETRDNCILILAESFESWVIEKTVEGKEITPNINRLLKGPETFYAPYVLTQVKGSRSIDGQLLLHTGMLPINFGAYSVRFPHHTYYSIDKAFKEKYDKAQSCCFTVDKKIVWNVGVVAQDFGYDKLLDKPFWKLDEKTGPRHRLGDLSFLRQCAEKLEADEELFPTKGHTFVQCVTYSGHSPFIIPDESKRISFSAKIPQLLANYMVVANYTDHAIGLFVDRLRSQEKFKNTMIVITGDHEGFGVNRKILHSDPVGKEIISPERFTPLIVLNSPIGMRYEKVMGQVDMYPTLLDLLGCDAYLWRGLGRSVFSPHKKGFAISPQLEVIGDTVGVSEEEIMHAKKAWEISDLMICCDYFKQKKKKG